jgi:hypothetical protein
LVVDDRWRESIRLAVGATMPENSVACEDVLAELLEVSEAAADPAIRLAGYRLAAEALWDLGKKGRAQIERALQERITRGLAERLIEPAIADPGANLLMERIMAGQVLGRLGDLRDGVTTLPPRLIPVIQEKFLYGEKKEKQETMPFQAGIYPITNIQFQQFIEVEGYKDPTWWSEAGWRWSLPAANGGGMGAAGPGAAWPGISLGE